VRVVLLVRLALRVRVLRVRVLRVLRVRVLRVVRMRVLRVLRVLRVRVRMAGRLPPLPPLPALRLRLRPRLRRSGRRGGRGAVPSSAAPRRREPLRRSLLVRLRMSMGLTGHTTTSGS
jgi:hypothetical protein